MDYQTVLSSIGPSAFEESNGLYLLKEPVALDALVAITCSLLEQRFIRSDYITGPSSIKDYLRARLAMREQEVFACVFLDAQHGVLAYEELFFGTVNAATVHRREIVKRSLVLNACAAVVCHNHPSGQPEPSAADRRLTKSL